MSKVSTCVIDIAGIVILVWFLKCEALNCAKISYVKIGLKVTKQRTLLQTTPSSHCHMMTRYPRVYWAQCGEHWWVAWRCVKKRSILCRISTILLRHLTCSLVILLWEHWATSESPQRAQSIPSVEEKNTRVYRASHSVPNHKDHSRLYEPDPKWFKSNW